MQSGKRFKNDHGRDYRGLSRIAHWQAFIVVFLFYLRK